MVSKFIAAAAWALFCLFAPEADLRDEIGTVRRICRSS